MKKKSLNAQKINHKYLRKLLNQNQVKLIFNKFEKQLNTQQSYLVAISGGPDSLALAFLSKCFQLKYNTKFYYYIVDHNLRVNSSKEAVKASKILKKINIKCRILKWRGSKPSSNIQAIARHYRYALLEKQCVQTKSTNILLGRQKEDLYENFFIRMIRGSGLKGLISLEKKTTIDSINLIRPLLDFEKKNLEFISNHVYNFYIKDPSNENTDFKRVKIRKIIEEFKMSGLEKDKLFLTLKNLKSSNNVIKFYTEQNKKLNSTLDKKTNKLFLNKIFFNQPHEVVFRSFSDSLKIISGRYFSPRGKKIDNILQMIKKDALKKETLAGCIVKKVNQTVIISKEY